MKEKETKQKRTKKQYQMIYTSVIVIQEANEIENMDKNILKRQELKN